MEEQLFFWIRIALISFAVMGLIQFALAMRALWVEYRAGLAPSYGRLIITATIAVLLLAITAWGRTVEPLDIVVRVEPVQIPDDQSDEELQSLVSQRDKLQNNLTDLRNELRELEQRINTSNERIRARQNEIESKIEGVNPFLALTTNVIAQLSNIILLLILSIILVIAGTAGLFIFGDPNHLLPERWLSFLRKKSKEQVEAQQNSFNQLELLARSVQNEQYERGYRLAKSIDSSKLNQLDELDFLFLKSYCGVQLLLSAWLEGKIHSQILESREKREGLIEQIIEDLETVLTKAPRMAEAEYLLAVTLAGKQEYKEALERFERAETRLTAKVADFDRMKSYCMLNMAEELLREADNEGADQLFDEVIALDVMADKISGILVENRLLQITEHFRGRRFDEARQGIKTIQQMEGLTREHQQSIQIIAQAMEIMFLFSEKRTAETLKGTEAFLDKWSPPKLPPTDEQTADEYMFSVLDEKELTLAPEIYRAFYFLKAIALIQMQATLGKEPSREEADRMAHSLLRSLQFEPRHREVLAALGALYFWFVPEKRLKALEWLEASRSMGTESDYLQGLLQRYRDVEIERKLILDRFMILSARYLADATVNTSMKEALVDELGQFQEFRPILIDLEDLDTLQEKSPTLESLRNRTQYLQELSSSMGQTQMVRTSDRFRAMSDKYVNLISVIETTSSQIETLEQEIMQELGKEVLQ